MYGHIHTILGDTPNRVQIDEKVLSACLETCVTCEVICSACADACLGESEVEELRRCIRLNLDCADVCGATGRVLARQREPDVAMLRAQVEACMLACAACASECERHAKHHAHCRACGEACRTCQENCRQLLATLPAAA